MQKSVNSIFKLIGLSLFFICNLCIADNSVTLVTYNIYNEQTPAGTPHVLCKTGSCTTELWPSRKDKIANLIKAQDADIIALQEDIQHQVEHIEKVLGPSYSRIGLSAAPDGYPDIPNGIAEWPSKALHSIFYKYKKFTQLNNGHFWLSATPEIELSTFENSRRAGVISWGKFLDNTNSKAFYVFNAHLHAFRQCKYQIVRAKETALLIEKIDQINKEQLPVIVLGDLNLTWQNQSDRKILNVLTDPLLTSATLTCSDTSGLYAYSLHRPNGIHAVKASFNIHSCNQSSCTVLPMIVNNQPFYRKYDYILLSRNINIINQSIQGQIPYVSQNNSFYLSDHAMVTSTVDFSAYPDYKPQTILIEFEDDFFIPVIN